MNKIVLVLVVALIGTVAAVSSDADPHFSKFMAFIRQHNKEYSDASEFVFRFDNFKQSIARIAERNARSDGGNVFGLNKFSDLSVAEFKSQYLGHRGAGVPANATVVRTPISAPTGETVDWRKKGAVTPVKDQEQCGSCWAFSTTEEIESMWFLAGHDLPVLSPQQIVSCDTTDAGCNGGDTVTAYAYVEKAGGIESESAYPYTSGGGNSGTCKFNAKDVVAKIRGFSYATPPCTGSCNSQDETQLNSNMAAKGPVSICVYAESWQDYTGGIFTSAADCPHAYSDLDHCVQIVGSNTESSTPYWIIRNSWNTNWGEDGYIYLKMGSNLCGVADEATFATI